MPDFMLEQFRRLPQRPDAVWQGAMMQMPMSIREEGREPYQPWGGLWVVVQDDDAIHPLEMCEPGEESPAMLWDGLLELATDDEIGGYRPGRVELRDPDAVEHLEPLLAAAGIEVVLREKLPHVDEAMERLIEGVEHRSGLPGCFSGEGVTAELMHRFAEAAEAFYQAAPWQHLTDEDLIAIEAPRAPAGLRFATVLGAAGETFGIGFFRSPEDFWDCRRAEDHAAWFRSREHGVWSLTFDDISRLPTEDALLWAETLLPVAADPAYPCLMQYTTSGGAVRPNAGQLEFVTRLLWALAETSEHQLDQGRWTMAAGQGGGKVTLALPDLLDPPDHQEMMRRGYDPDRRAMERVNVQIDRFLAGQALAGIEEVNAAIEAEFMGKPFDPEKHPPQTPAEQAQDLCYEAFEARGRRQVTLAREALQLHPDCADAYVLLAENSGDPEEAARLYSQGVEAGRRALGERRFREDAGEFWGLLDTRPFMRALVGLAQCCDLQGRHDEAVDHYRELLELNPGDNQGVRYLYLPLLLRLGRDTEAARYLEQSQDEPTAMWCYTRALLTFRRSGDTDAARRDRARAVKTNRHAVEMLTQGAEPQAMPPSYALGSPEEAAICAGELGPAYRATAGALAWLAGGLEEQATSRSRPHRRFKRRKRRSR